MKKPITLLGLLYLWLFSIGTTNAQAPWTYSPIPAEYTEGYAVTYTERLAVLNSEDCWVDLTNALGPNPDTTGNTNYRAQIQAMIDSSPIKNFKMPNFPVKIDMASPYSGFPYKTGIFMPSNCKLYFPPNAAIRVDSCLNSTYLIINILNKSNVKVYYANIRGDRYTHLGTTGQFGYGISIIGSNDILIDKARVRECWGDGIYIGGTLGTTYIDSLVSKRVILNKCISDNNRRQGMTIISVEDLVVNGGIFSNSNGSQPQSGIDIEPSQYPATYLAQVKDVVFNDIVTYNNKGDFGFIVSIWRSFRWDSITAVQKSISVTVNNHISDNDYICAMLNIDDNDGYLLQGNITFNKPIWKNPRYLGDGSNSRYLRCQTRLHPLTVLVDWGCDLASCAVANNVHNRIDVYYQGLWGGYPIPDNIITWCNGNGWVGEIPQTRDCPELIAALTTQSAGNTPKASDFKLSAYPNPVQNAIVIQREGLPGYDALITLYDFMGKAVATYPMPDNLLSINLSHLTMGVYTLRYSDHIRSSVIKVVKK